MRTNWHDAVFANPPDVTVTDADLVADGDLIDVTDLGVTRDGSPLNRLTAQLYGKLARFVVEFDPELDPGTYDLGQLRTLVAFVVDGARDTAEDGEPKDWLYSTHPVSGFGEPVFLQHNDAGGWTALLASDY